MTKIEWLKLLQSKNLLWNNEAFTLTEEDKSDGLTSVDEKIDMEFSGEYGENYAEVQDGHKLITIMRGQEGINEYVADKIRYLDSDELISIIRKMPGGLKSVLQDAWNWKLQEDGEFTFSIATTASLNISRLLCLADRLDKKGLFVEANELDSLVIAHCGHCDSDKKKKKKKAAQLVLAMVKKALQVNPSASTVLIDNYLRGFANQAERMGISLVEVQDFINKIKGKTVGDIINQLDADIPVHDALIQILGLTGAVLF